MAHSVSRDGASVSVLTEEETGRGWKYRVRVGRDAPGEAATEHEVTLAWVDHEHWCAGRVPPSATVETVVRYLVEHSHPLPARFDAAAARRWFPRIDREIRMPD